MSYSDILWVCLYLVVDWAMLKVARMIESTRARYHSNMGLFRKLPGELRNLIYIYIAFPSVQIGHACRVSTEDEVFSPGILRTCRKINREATPILYSNMCFKTSIEINFETQEEQGTVELHCHRKLTISRWPSPLMQFVRNLSIKLCFGMFWEHNYSMYGFEDRLSPITFHDVARYFPALECLVLFHCRGHRPRVFTAGYNGHLGVFFEDCLKPFMNLPRLKKILLGIYSDRNDRKFGKELAEAVGQVGWNWSRERQSCEEDVIRPRDLARWRIAAGVGRYIYTLNSKSLTGQDEKVIDDMVRDSLSLRIIPGSTETL